MKQRRLILLLVCVLLAAVSSCGNGSKKSAADMADKFISAYFSADYKTAASLCSEGFGNKVAESELMVSTLPEDLKREFFDLAKSIETHRGEIYEFSEDSLLVEFDIIVPGEIEPLRNAVCVVRPAGTEEWKVVEMR